VILDVAQLEALLARTFSIGLDVGRGREKVALVRLRLSKALRGAAETQAMAAGALAIAGFGEDWITHLFPFHRSARLAFANEPPTAVQAEGEVQATPSRRTPCTPAGLGVGWMLQRVPFQRSASVARGLPEVSTLAPTAVQTDGEGHATQVRVPPPGEDGFGVG